MYHISVSVGCILQKTSLDNEMLVPEGKATRVITPDF